MRKSKSPRPKSKLIDLLIETEDMSQEDLETLAGSFDMYILGECNKKDVILDILDTHSYPLSIIAAGMNDLPSVEWDGPDKGYSIYSKCFDELTNLAPCRIFYNNDGALSVEFIDGSMLYWNDRQWLWNWDYGRWKP